MAINFDQIEVNHYPQIVNYWRVEGGYIVVLDFTADEVFFPCRNNGLPRPWVRGFVVQNPDGSLRCCQWEEFSRRVIPFYRYHQG